MLIVFDLRQSEKQKSLHFAPLKFSGHLFWTSVLLVLPLAFFFLIFSPEESYCFVACTSLLCFSVQVVPYPPVILVTFLGK